MAETAVMSMLSSVKDVVVGRAMKLMGAPRVSKVMSDPRLMNAAMKAMNAGGSVKGGIDRVTQAAAGALGWLSQEEAADLRSTITTLHETVTALESRAASAEARAADAEAKLASVAGGVVPVAEPWARATPGTGKSGAKKS